jgi:hypothetical protein
MKGITREETPMAIEGGGVEFRRQPIGGGMSAAFVRLPQGTDLRPAVAGLPDDLCPCPHWGYVLAGKVRMHTLDGALDYEAGQAYYWAAGHAPEALEDTEFVEFSPSDELDHVIEHITSQG